MDDDYGLNTIEMDAAIVVAMETGGHFFWRRAGHYLLST
ncbi:hypothetical protein DSUL_50278 [Desulfovibrionales bacterium]